MAHTSHALGVELVSGAASERLAKYIDDRHAGKTAKPADELSVPGAYGRNPHTGPIAAGDRDKAILSYVRLHVGKGHTRDELVALVTRRHGEMVQPEGDVYPLAEALGKIDRALAKFEANPDAVEALAEGVTLPQALRDRLKVKAVADEVARLQARREAVTIDREIESLRNPRPPVDFGTLKALLKRSETTKWRVEGLLAAEARMLVVAQRKTGKTTLTINLIRSLLTGEPFLGRFPVESLTGSVMVLNYEVTGATYAEWVGDTGIPTNLHNRVHIVNLRGRENLLATEAGRATLAAMMLEAGVEVLLVDPFGRAFSGEDQNSASQVSPWLVSLDRVATDGGARELILVAHAGWGDKGGSVRARGSSGLEDWADVIVRYSRERELPGSPRFLEAEGRDVSVELDRLEYDPATRLLSMTGAGGPTMARRNAKAHALREPILELIRVTGGITSGGIEEGLRRLEPPVTFTRGDPAAAVNALVVESKVERYRDGRSMHHYLPGSVPKKFKNRTSE